MSRSATIAAALAATVAIGSVTAGILAETPAPPSRPDAKRAPLVTREGARPGKFSSAGAPTVGEILTTSNGTWLNKPTSFDYQWEACNASGGACTKIYGETSNTYVAQVADISGTLRAVVTARNAAGAADQTSGATGTVTCTGVELCPAAPYATTGTRRQFGGLGVTGSIFRDPSFFGQPLPSNTGVNPNNSAYMATLLNALATGPPASSNGFLGQAANFRIVPSNQPYVQLCHYSPVSHTVYTDANTRDLNAGGAPIPSDFTPGPGTDATGYVYQPSRDILWEFWKVKDPGGEAECPADQWEYAGGGKVYDTSKSNGIFPNKLSTGATATANNATTPRVEEEGTISNGAGGTMGVGQIDHPILLSLPNAVTLKSGTTPAGTPNGSPAWSWPAQATDGGGTNAAAYPPEGLIIRFPAALDINNDANGLCTTIPLTQFACTIAVAAQRYGFYLGNTSSDVQLNIGPGGLYTKAGLPDPYATLWGACWQHGNSHCVMTGFPWSQLVFLPYDSWNTPAIKSPTSLQWFTSDSPADGATVSGSVYLDWQSGNTTVASVQPIIDGDKYGAPMTTPLEGTTTRWRESLNTTLLTNGNHTIFALMTDTSNNQLWTAPITINVQN